MKKLLVQAGFLAGVVVAVAGASSGRGTNTFTLHFSEPGAVVTANNPCLGAMTSVLSYDAVLHVTDNANGSHSIITLNGSADITPANPAIPAFTGRFNETQSVNVNSNVTVTTFVVNQLGAQGKSFHITFHTEIDNVTGLHLSVLNIGC